MVDLLAASTAGAIEGSPKKIFADQGTADGLSR
jgi:hypothetical protein